MADAAGPRAPPVLYVPSPPGQAVDAAEALPALGSVPNPAVMTLSVLSHCTVGCDNVSCHAEAAQGSQAQSISPYPFCVVFGLGLSPVVTGATHSPESVDSVSPRSGATPCSGPSREPFHKVHVSASQDLTLPLARSPLSGGQSCSSDPCGNLSRLWPAAAWCLLLAR